MRRTPSGAIAEAAESSARAAPTQRAMPRDAGGAEDK